MKDGGTTHSERAKVQINAISEGRRPRLLFFAYHFPPVQAIASVRTWNIAKCLAQLGWDVTVVTPEPKLWRHLEGVDRTKAELTKEGIRQILTDHHWRFLAPNELICWDEGMGWMGGGICRRIARRAGVDRGVGWIKAAERACRGLHPQDVDLILASGPPFSAFVLAEGLSKNLGRPYVLDYRDPWTEVPGMSQALRPMVVRLEARLLSGSAAVTTVSQSWALDLDSRFNVGSKLHVVRNGYVPEELAEVKPHNFGHFAIVYAGIFYPPERVITPVMAALQRLKMKCRTGEWYFHYYGDDNLHVREEAARLGVIDRVKLHGWVSRSEALSAIRGANIGVVLTSVLGKASIKASGWVPAKLFEMIGLGTPILLVAPPGTDVESVAEPTRLAHRFTGDDVDGIAAFIDRVMSGVTFMKKDTDSFKWDYIGRKFDHILREVVELDPTVFGS